jgi:UDP-2-acetamido-3-amino-2,3-dideoxy-glucuronate N-acetyltransferase
MLQIKYWSFLMIHKLANVYDSEIGDGTRVAAFAEIGRATIGKNCSIGCSAFIPENVIIKDNVFIAPHVVFTNDKNAPSNGAWRAAPPTVVEDGVSIGANATILPNITIGAGAKIGAGAVVTKSVPPGAVMVGNPARMVGEGS